MPDSVAGKGEEFCEFIETCLGQLDHMEAKIMLRVV